jgi:hypothetical protein
MAETADEAAEIMKREFDHHRAYLMEFVAEYLGRGLTLDQIEGLLLKAARDTVGKLDATNPHLAEIMIGANIEIVKDVIRQHRERESR